jgi:hypothetical protein
MTQISRSELLDKLASGWKVRRKSWPNETSISSVGGSIMFNWAEMLENDWEGEASGPKKSFSGLNIFQAFSNLKPGVFIRRALWKKETKLPAGVSATTLRIEDILTCDWEVWE